MHCFNPAWRVAKHAALALSLAAASFASHAYATFEGSPSWGAGTVVTWSIMPEGTGVVRTPNAPAFLFEDFWNGNNNLTAVYTQLDADPAVGKTLFNTALSHAFATWSAAANITFLQVTDDGSPIGFQGDPANKVGDIRIGAYSFGAPFDALAAHTFEPPGGTSSLAAYWATTNQQSDFGDLNLNSDAHFGVAPGTEGAHIDDTLRFYNDLEGLLLHEIGHALGLAHPEQDGVTGNEAAAVMYVGTGCCDNIHRTLGEDDIAGIQALYGAPLAASDVPEPPTWLLLAAGVFAWMAARRRRAPKNSSWPSALQAGGVRPAYSH